MQKIILFISLVLLGTVTRAQNIDIDLLKPINKTGTGFKDNLADISSKSVTIASIGAPVGVFAAGLIRHDKKLQWQGVYMAGAYIVSAIATQGIKIAIDRKRPFQEYSYIIKRDTESGGKSFPSGHTSAAFCTATSLALNFPKWYVIIPSYLYAATVGWARMYQGVHYPMDVFVGALVGAGSAWAGYALQKKMEQKKSRASKPSF